MAEAHDIVTLETARQALSLGLTDVSRNADLERVISAASTIVEDHAGIVIKRQFTETHDGRSYYLTMRQRPVVSVDAATVDGTALSAGELAEYVVPSDNYGQLEGNYSRPSKPSGLSITYTAGRFADTDAVTGYWREAALIQIRHQWQHYQEAVGEVNEFDTAAVARIQAGPARGLLAHLHGHVMPGLA